MGAYSGEYTVLPTCPTDDEFTCHSIQRGCDDVEVGERGPQDLVRLGGGHSWESQLQDNVPFFLRLDVSHGDLTAVEQTRRRGGWVTTVWWIYFVGEMFRESMTLAYFADAFLHFSHTLYAIQYSRIIFSRTCNRSVKFVNFFSGEINLLYGM